MVQLRPKQKEVVAFRSGRMGVAAVPGSGKTFTLSYLAASLIAEPGRLNDDQEVLIVTLSNSAANNFTARLRQTLYDEFGLIPNLGYRVRTLHGLAHDIVRERPALVGLDSEFKIIDEREAEALLDKACEAWIRAHPELREALVRQDLNEGSLHKVESKDWPALVRAVASQFVRTAKDYQATPLVLSDALAARRGNYPLLQMGLEIYSDYQHSLRYNAAVDFADLIRLALQALRLDPDLLQRLRYQWPYILEDEAQDSSQLQEDILRTLAGDDGNWVRVGDPNQAIYETFTTANPQLLLDFLAERGVAERSLPNSGRSTRSIIDLANYLVEWTRTSHPNFGLRDALAENYIEPAPPGDPRPNPPDQPQAIHLVNKAYESAAELDDIARSAGQWVAEHPDQTVAVLLTRNDRGEELVGMLERRKIPYREMLRSTRTSRETARALADALFFLGTPENPGRLAKLYQVYRQVELDGEDRLAYARVKALLERCRQVEAYLRPARASDWLAAQPVDGLVRAELEAFRPVALRWLDAAPLPVDQLALTIGQDLFHDPGDLALTDKLAGLLKQTAAAHPEWDLTTLAKDLLALVSKSSQILDFVDEENGFQPEQYAGQVVVTTVHKAKGLEWDRVYLPAVNTYDFPSALPEDSFMGEKWFLRNQLNLEALALTQLKGLLRGDLAQLHQSEADVQTANRLEYARERLRLLYVGITRARRSLVMTWNTGKHGDQRAALPFIALQEYWKERSLARP